MIEKIFLGWDEPFLWLVENYLRENSGKFDNLTNSRPKITRVITPSKRSSRRLIELLCAKADEENLPTINIEVSTVAELPRILFRNCAEPVDRLESLLLWKEALSRIQAQKSKLNLLSADDPIFYLESLRDLLSSVGYRPRDIIEKIESEHTGLDLSLWENINDVWEAYETILDENNIFDAAKILFSSRDNTQEIILKENLVLAGCHNFAPVLFNPISKIQSELKILINAPEIHQAGFNEIGVLNSEYWVQNFPKINSDNIILLDSDSDQTKWVSEELIKLRHLKFPQELISVIPLDPSITGPLELAIENSGFKAVIPGSKNLKNSSIGNFVLAIADYSSGNESALNRVLEHPLMLFFIKNNLELDLETSIISFLDKIQQLSTERSIGHHGILAKKHSEIFLKLKELLVSINLVPIKGVHPLNFFAVKFIEILKLFTGPKTISLYTYEEIEKLSSYLLNILENTNLSRREISAKDFYNFLKEILYKEEISGEHANGIEVLGWLEAQLDDSQACFILSCNENYLPQKTSLDPLLPNSFKNSIGLPSKKLNDGLNSFAIHTLINSKKIIKFSAPKITFSGDLTKISKFIALGSSAPLSNLVKEFYEGGSAIKREQGLIKVSSNLIKPIQHDQFPLDNLSPTKIKSYLRCPYSFYLQYVLKADIVDYEPLELTPLVFGSVLHSLFEAIGNSEVQLKSRDEFNRDTEKIFNQIFSKYLGINPSIILQIQRSLLLSKFESFKTWHLDSIEEGWKILACEHNIFDDTSFVLDKGRTISFKGKLDRLEYHPDLKEIRCIDFKTGNNAYGFKQALTKKGWQDPQIPLYVKLLQNNNSEFKQVLESSKVNLMYVSFPKNGDLVIDDRPYDQETGENVLEVVQNVAQSIQDGIFWPPKDLDLYVERVFGQLPQNISVDDLDYESEFEDQEY